MALPQRKRSYTAKRFVGLQLKVARQTAMLCFVQGEQYHLRRRENEAH